MHSTGCAAWPPKSSSCQQPASQHVQSTSAQCFDGCEPALDECSVPTSLADGHLVCFCCAGQSVRFASYTVQRTPARHQQSSGQVASPGSLRALMQAARAPCALSMPSVTSPGTPEEVKKTTGVHCHTSDPGGGPFTSRGTARRRTTCKETVHGASAELKMCQKRQSTCSSHRKPLVQACGGQPAKHQACANLQYCIVPGSQAARGRLFAMPNKHLPNCMHIARNTHAAAVSHLGRPPVVSLHLGPDNPAWLERCGCPVPLPNLLLPLQHVIFILRGRHRCLISMLQVARSKPGRQHRPPRVGAPLVAVPLLVEPRDLGDSTVSSAGRGHCSHISGHQEVLKSAPNKQRGDHLGRLRCPQAQR